MTVKVLVLSAEEDHPATAGAASLDNPVLPAPDHPSNPVSPSTVVTDFQSAIDTTEYQNSHISSLKARDMPAIGSYITGTTSQAATETVFDDHQNYTLPPEYSNGDYKMQFEGFPCELIPNRPAAWIVKSSGTRLSSLAAAILIDNGMITSDVIALINSAYPTAPVDPGPTDPVSGILTATNRTVVGIVAGLVDYPVAVSRMATSDTTAVKREAASFAFDSNKGVSRMVGTALKAPMEFTTGISQGFNNVQRVWGGDAMPVEQVTGASSGLKAGAKSLGMGLVGGVAGFFIEPVKGIQEGGVKGGMGGFVKGIGGLICKPAAGVAGLPACTFQGLHQEFRKHRGMNYKVRVAESQLQQGWEELAATTLQEREDVLTKWRRMGYGEARG